MTTYILRRILLVIPTLFGITLLTFLLIRLAPGNAALIKGSTGENGSHAMSAEAREQTIKLYGLDENPVAAYGKWLGNVVRLNFGQSFVDHRPVLDKIGERIGLSTSLAGTALMLSYAIAVPLGILGALRRGQPVDRAISFAVFFLYSIPVFVAALVLILFVAGGDYLNLLPMYGANSINASEMNLPAWLWDRTLHMILPVICLTYASLASISRYTRTSMLEVLGQDYLRTARAKGLSERRVNFLQALRNAMIPILTVFAMELPGIIGGTIIVEYIFTLPGMGQLMFQSIEARDQFVIMGIVTIVAVATLLSYLLADILYVLVDPRIRYE
jgi:peptide/nickel transport system permease protein